MTSLHVEGISMAFGGLKAVTDFSITLEPSRLCGLIGPNGAGKTTVFNMLTGVYRPQSGVIRLGEKRLDGLKPHQIAAAGVARTFQNIRLFPDLSVLDNVRVAGHLRSGGPLIPAILRTPRHVGRERHITARARELLDTLNLLGREHEQARNLPYGDQRRLEIARALATEPSVLLLDEPAAGMNPQEKIELRSLIRTIQSRFNLSILLIEHDMGLVMDICERITVLDHGVTIARGAPQEIQRDEKVIEAYLGEPAPSATSTADHPPTVAVGVPSTLRAVGDGGAGAPTAALVVEGLHVHYGAIHALKGISLRVEPGKIVTLIGGNGAGKSTTLRTISGLLKPTSGSISFNGQPIAGMPPHALVRRGLVQSPEGRGIFANLTVEENLSIGAITRSDRGAMAEDRERALSLFPRLKERLRQNAGTLSGGEQQMLAMARALMARPKVLLLDEPSLGLAPQVVQLIFKIIRDINAAGTTILLVEQNAHMALEVAHDAYVLEVGEIVMQGPGPELARSDEVRKAYLGVA